MTTVATHCPRCGAEGTITKPTSAGTVVFTCSVCGQATNYHSVAGIDHFDCPICGKTGISYILGTKLDTYKERSIFWYDFSEGEGASLIDKSWAAKNATITGATWIDDGDGHALRYDGNDKAVCASPAFPTGAISKLTSIFKVKSSYSADWYWIAHGAQRVADGSYTVTKCTNHLYYRYSNGASATQNIDDDDFFTAHHDEWVYLAIVADYDTREVKFYRGFEGAVHTQSMTTPVKISGNRVFEVGADVADSVYFVGDIGLAALIPEALTQTEIEEIFFLS